MRALRVIVLATILLGCGASGAPLHETPTPAPVAETPPEPVVETPRAAPGPRHARAVLGTTTVRLTDAPGALVDTSAPPPAPGAAPSHHSAVHGSCEGDALDCSAAGEVVRAAPTFDAAVEGLRSLGYTVTIETP